TVIPTGQCTTNPDGSFTCTGFAPNGAASASCSSAGTCTLTCNGATASNVPIASVVSAAPGLCGVGAVRSVSLQTTAQAARQSSQVWMTAVQSQIMSIRDSIQAGRSRSGMTGRPIGFAAEPSSDRLESNPLYDNELADLLGYARTDSKSPLYKPAPAPTAAPAVAPAPVWSVWGQGFGDWERRTGSSNGIDIGRRTLTGGGLVGLDVTFSNF